MGDSLVGLQVSIEVQEGLPEDLVTLSGIIVREWKDPDGTEFVVVRLYRPTKWGLATGRSAGDPSSIF